MIKNKKKKKPVKKKARIRKIKKLQSRQVGSSRQGPVYVLNPDFGSFYELRDLVLKSLPAEKDNMVEKINRLGKIKLAIISGTFINKDNPDPLIADLLIVGDYIDSRKLRSFLKFLEAEVGKEIKYSVMDKEEFQYRLTMFDRFIRALLEGPHEKLINKLGV